MINRVNVNSWSNSFTIPGLGGYSKCIEELRKTKSVELLPPVLGDGVCWTELLEKVENMIAKGIFVLHHKKSKNSEKCLPPFSRITHLLLPQRTSSKERQLWTKFLLFRKNLSELFRGLIAKDIFKDWKSFQFLVLSVSMFLDFFCYIKINQLEKINQTLVIIPDINTCSLDNIT